MSPSATSTVTTEGGAGAAGILLDTQAFLWLAAREELVPKATRKSLQEAETALWLSTASIWEMAIKRSLGKLATDLPLGALIASQCEAMAVEILPVQRDHALGVETLPFHHRDPFDRLLIAQAIAEGLTIASSDEIFDRYPVARVW